MLIVETIAKEVAILFVFVLIVLDLAEVFILVMDYLPLPFYRTQV